MRPPVNIAGWLRHQVRGLGSLVAVIAIVFGVLAFALVSMNPPDYASQLAAGASATSKAPAMADESAQLFLEASPKRPIPLVASIDIHGWKNRSNRIVDAQITSVSIVESETTAVEASAAAYPVGQIVAQLRGKRVLASVGPRAVGVLPSSGKARVDLVVTPAGRTATLLIDEVREPVSSVAVAAAYVPGPQSAVDTVGVVAATVAGDATAGIVTASAAGRRARVTGLSAYWGAPGTRVVMTGTGFGTSTKSWVSCAGVRARVLSWSDTQVTFVVPSKMTRQGYVGVVVGGRVSNGMFFCPFNPPKITEITPREGAAGTAVTLRGTGFGRSQRDGWVTFAGATAQVLSWSDTAIRVVVPRTAVSGYAGVVAHGLTSNGILYGPLGAPLVETVSDRLILPGDEVVLRGRNFGTKTGSVVVGGFGGNTKITSWTPSEVRFTALARLQSGYVGVIRGDGWTSNGKWVWTAPRMLSLSRTTAPRGADITLSGTGFGRDQQGQTVFICGAAAVVRSWSDTSIVAQVPVSAAATGYVGVGSPVACSNGKFLMVVAP